MAESESSHLLVAAFDFGTTYSGYAFSFRNDPMKVQTNQSWIAGSEKLISLKTPTCVLLSPDKKFHSFGFEAENKYGSLAEDEVHQEWLLFRRFKMLLHSNEELSRATTVEDINGKKMPALTIFSMSIRYLRDHLLAQLNNQTTGVDETDIKYVLTVPAIWENNAKQFMREAAVQAGVDTNRLKLALEPEAASIWCQAVTTEAKGALSGSGTKYMVVDLGGGTADISVHEKNCDETLNEVHKASGGPWGGVCVDNNYLRFLEQLFGKKALQRLKMEDMAEYFEVLREFETKKRSIHSDKKELITFRISATLREMSEKEEGITLEQNIASMDLKKHIHMKKDKMRLDPDIIKTWFDEPVDNVIHHVKKILAEPKMGSISSILLVGGFGESQYVQKKIQIGIINTRLIVPNEAGLAVLKGAVRFGHTPNLVAARVMGLSYGVRVYEPFNESIHPPSLMVLVNGEENVDNVFDTFVSCGDTIKVGHEVKKTYTPSGMNSTGTEVYCSTDSTPKYTSDPTCRKLGELSVKHPEGNMLEDKKFDAILVFGDTELIVKARILKTGKEFFTCIDCLK